MGMGAVMCLGIATALAAGPIYRVHVDGLACPFCAYGIEKKLGEIDGVERVETDIAAGAVTVIMGEGVRLDEAAAARAVREAGFSMRRLERVGPASPEPAR